MEIVAFVLSWIIIKRWGMARIKISSWMGVKGMQEEIWGKAATIKGYLMGSMEI